MPDVFPPGWTKTVTDLTAAVHSAGGAKIEKEEIDWAIAYTRSLLRRWARFPLNDEIHEAIEDSEVAFLTYWKAPCTGGGRGLLPKGTRVCVHVYSIDPEPIGVNADPLDRDIIERILIPEADRADPEYNGFALSITTEELNKHFRLVVGEHR
jgi:hypothetical protein